MNFSGLVLDGTNYSSGFGAPEMGLTPRELERNAQVLAGMLDTFASTGRQLAHDRKLTRDSIYATGNAFVTGELELPNFDLNQPLTGITHVRDIDNIVGGGWVDKTSNFFVDYASAGTNQYGLMGVDTNVIPTIQGNVSKELYSVFRFAYSVRIPVISEARMAMIPRSLQEILQDGLRLTYDKMLDDNAYFGLTPVGTKGIVNQPTTLNGSTASTVYKVYSAANGAGSSRLWADKTPDQILVDFNDFLTAIIANTNYAVSAMGSSTPLNVEALPDHVLMPWPLFSQLNTRLISSAGSQSILTYLKENNICKANGVDLKIVPCRQCNSAGDDVVTPATSSGRIVAYKRNRKFIHYNETVPLTRLMTMPDANTLSYISQYVASVGQVKVLYYQAMGYLDGAVLPSS